MRSLSDRLFWGFLVSLVVVVVGVGLWAARAATPSALPEYRSDQTRPENVVYNAYVAARRKDVDRFLAYFKGSPWGREGTIIGVSSYALDRGELRIGEVTVTGDRAVVQVLLVMPDIGPLLGPEVRVQTETVYLERVNGQWYIVTPLPFVYPEWKVAPPPVPRD